MKRKISLLLFLLISTASFAADGVVFNDVSRLNPVTVNKIVKVHGLKDISDAIVEAKDKGLKVSISGKRHSQGGQQSCANCIVLDMMEYNKVISLDNDKKIIRVQPGMTWEQIQNYLQPFGYAVKVMQASNIFTVGGALGPNIHGNDPNYGAIIETVESFHLMRPDLTVVNVSRQENPELFKLVIGGYGLFGVIIDVTLSLTDDVIYEMQSKVMDYKEYPEFVKTYVLNHPSVGLHSAKLSNAPSSLLREIVTTTYIKSTKYDKALFKLQEEKDVERNKMFFGLSRISDWGKDLRWDLQKRLIAKVGQIEYVSRNNAMRPIVKFLDYYSSKDTDILQEYFVPMEKFVLFVDGLREIIKTDHVNLLSITVRYMPQDKESFLPYAKTNSFALVLYINQKLTASEMQKAQTWTRKIVDLSLDCGGTYYLPYQLYPSRQQLLRAYPEFDEFIKKKEMYDSEDLFVNQFYKHYRL